MVYLAERPYRAAVGNTRSAAVEVLVVVHDVLLIRGEREWKGVCVRERKTASEIERENARGVSAGEDMTSGISSTGVPRS